MKLREVFPKTDRNGREFPHGGQGSELAFFPPDDMGWRATPVSHGRYAFGLGHRLVNADGTIVRNARSAQGRVNLEPEPPVTSGPVVMSSPVKTRSHHGHVG